MAQIKKTQTDKSGVPKGMVRGERSEGKLYKKADADKWGKGMSDAMDRQAGLGKYAPKKKMEGGGMIKRADGSYSKRGLWDNIRANKGSGKKPTAQMLKQEKKIKAKTK
jgi:hypothetical protein